jgi:hypothetical protein
MLCVLAYKFATYALPFMVALAATRFAYATGAGLVGAGLVGVAAAAASFSVMALLFATVRAPILRVIVAVIFVAPAALAGYALVHGVTGEAVPSSVWREVFCIVGGVSTGLSALARLTGTA